MVVGPVDNNVFVVRCRATGDAVLLDAANEHEQLLELCQRLGVKRVLETHGHWDHIQAVPAMREAGYEVAVTSLDAPKLKEVGYDVFIDDAEVIEVGRLRLHAIHNPGHTPGSISFALHGTPLLFTGDTLFPGGPGNTSFDDADFDTIITSITTKLFTFPDDTIVLPGHGPTPRSAPNARISTSGSNAAGERRLMRYDERPVDPTPIHTDDLPPTPIRDRNIPATAWVEAPDSLLTLGDDLPDRPVADYKRRIGTWLLWRAGPATKANARYFACAADDPARHHTFALGADGTGHGIGPSGEVHTRFREWKIDLKSTSEPA